MAEENDKKNIEDELKDIKDEMRELKEMLKKQKTEGEGVHVGGRSEEHKFRVGFDSDFEGVDDTLNLYLDSVMSGVADSLKSSVQQMTKGFTLNLKNFEGIENLKDLGRGLRDVGREFERGKNRMASEGRRMAREARQYAHDRVRITKLTDEELAHFFEVGPQLMAALADEKKLQLLKALESGPEYQKDLSEKTNIKGGTFKHHMDSLLASKYIYQEQARGRYLINQLGIEALKLAEMLFRRFIFVTEKDAQMKEVEIEFDDDDEFEDKIDEVDDSVDEIEDELDEINDEINELNDTVEEMIEDQNEEEEG